MAILLSIVYGCGGPTVTMIDVTATASGGTEFNAGVWNQNNASPTMRQCKMREAPTRCSLH